ncbi:MAG: O-antigen ligase family protein [Bacteroidota bacterium]
MKQRAAFLFSDTSFSTKVTNFLFGDQRITSWGAWAVCILITVGLAYVMAKAGLLVPLLLIIVVIAAPIGLSAMWNTQIGIYIMIGFAYFLSVANRLLPNIPMGIALDTMILIMLLGLLYRCHQRKDWTPFHSPVSLALALWGGMNVLEFANPIAASRAAWFYVIRPALGYMMLFFLTYSMVKNRQQLYNLLFYLLSLNLITALWGIYQSFFGYFNWEMAHVIRNDAVHLVFNDGRWRSFGSIGSPAQYGILMAYTGCISFMMLTGFNKGFKKYFLIFSGICCIMAMLYSGTRSSFVIPAIYYFFWVVISRNIKLYSTIVIGAFGLVFLANMKTDNYQIQRIQTIFKASEDKSYQTRARNREMITPWILKHPIGGGLGSTGVWGQRFSPHTFLANFPPDSGLVRVAVELGWIGLLIFLNVYGTIIIKATFALWKMKNRKYKAMVAGFLCGIPPFLLVEWGQEVVGVFPISILFWIITAIIFKAIQLEKQERELAEVHSGTEVNKTTGRP